MDEKTKEIIKEMVKNGWGETEIAESYGLTESEVKNIGHNTEQTGRLEATKRVMYKHQELRKTVSDFREDGCALARCKDCDKPMFGVAEDRDGNYHYHCENCGWVDWKDKLCKDKCCRRGFAHLVEIDPDTEVTEESLEAFIEGEGEEDV